MNFSHSRISVNDDAESDGSVVITFFPDNVPVHYSVSIFELRKMLDQSKSVIKLEDKKCFSTGDHGN